MPDDIQKELFRQQDENYRKFFCKLIPNIDADTVIGVRTPALRKIAKQLAKKDDIQNYLQNLPHKYFDENQLHAFIISEIKDYDKNIDLDNDLDEINIKGKEKEPKNHEVKEINEIENLFKIAKRDEINLKDKKKEIENYAILKGKNLKNLLNKKDTYFNIYRLKNKELERNIILEELIFRRGSKIKLPSKNEKLYLL